MPDINDREEILKIHSRGKPLEKDVDLRVVAVRTPGFSGADLSNLINEAAILAARHNRKSISAEDIFNSIEKVLLGPARKSRVISQREKEITAYHEAGHALVAAAIKDADPVHKVSIVSRGMAGGYTLKLPTEERRLRTRSQFLADLAVAFGGYAAELAVFGDLSTGSSNDIRQATDLAHRLVTQYGMSEKFGPRTFGRREELLFLGREISMEKIIQKN
jgi:cell division protease FtsH